MCERSTDGDLSIAIQERSEVTSLRRTDKARKSPRDRRDGIEGAAEALTHLGAEY